MIISQVIKKHPQFELLGITYEESTFAPTVHIKHKPTKQEFQLTISNPDNDPILGVFNPLIDVIIDNWIKDKMIELRDNNIDNIIK